MKVQFVVIAGCLLINSCGEKEELEVSASLEFTESEFAKPNNADIFQLNKEDFANRLDKEKHQFTANNIDDDENEEEEDSACFSNVEKFKVKVTGENNDTISLLSEADISECIKSKSEAKFDSVKVEFKVAVNYHCPGIDLSQYDGMSFDDERLEKDPCQEADEMEMMIQVSSQFAFKVTGDQYSSEQDSITSSQFGSAVNEPCKATRKPDGIHLDDGCVDVTLEHQVKNIVNEKEESNHGKYGYVKITNSNIVEPDNETSPWYISGTKGVTINNWNGSVSYKGETIAPDYSFKNTKDDSQTHIGSFSDSNSAFNLVKDKKFRMLQDLKNKIESISK